MALIPFFEVHTKEDVVLTELITNFSFTDTIKRESTLSLDFKDKEVNFLSKNEWCRQGQELVFTFGYKNGNRSSKRVAVITEIDPNYSNTTDIRVKARDKGIFLKKKAAQTVYKDKTASQIAKTIAENYGFDTKEIEESTISYPVYPQGNKTDMELLQELAKKNDFTFFIRDAALHFKKNLLKTSSVLTLTYKDPNSIISRFSPKISYVNQPNAAKSVTVQGVDTETNEPFQETVEIDKAENDVKAGKAEVVYNFGGSVTVNNKPQTTPPTESSKQIETEGQIITTGQTSKEEAVKEATKVLKKAQMTNVEADLDLSILEPQLFAGDVITVANVDLFEGNYLIAEISHSISVGSARSNLKLKRNATNKSITKTNTEVAKTTEKNTEVGSETGVAIEKEPKQVRYGNDGSVSRE